MLSITDSSFTNNMVSRALGRENAHSNAESVDIRGVDSNQKWYEIVTLWGMISW